MLNDVHTFKCHLMYTLKVCTSFNVYIKNVNDVHTFNVYI